MHDQKVTINIYQLFDNELTRMHSLLAEYLKLPPTPHSYQQYNYGAGGSTYQHDIPEVYKRILHMQDVLIKQFTDRDEAIQEKVAELALTGDANTDSI